MELFKQYRPTTFDEVIGQDEAVSMLQSGEIPHAILFAGPSGCGKTTLAMILRRKLKCSKWDFHKINAANTKGIETARQIQDQIGLSPAYGKSKIWVLDEVHQATSAAQDCLLEPLEFTPDHVYFFLCTTNPQKVKKAVRNRCREITVKLLSRAKIQELLNYVCEREGKKFSDDVIDKIIDGANGSARKALVLLDSIFHLDSEEEQLDAIEKADVQKQGIELFRALLNPRTKWTKISSLLKELEEEPETLRAIVLTAANTTLLGAKQQDKRDRAYLMIEAFSEPFYEKKALLTKACYEVIFGEQS